MERLLEISKELGKIEPIKKPLIITFGTLQVTPEIVKKVSTMTEEDIAKAIYDYLKQKL